MGTHARAAIRPALVAAGVLALVAVLPTVLHPASFPNDFAVDHASARELIEGGDPYAPQRELLAEHAPEVADSYPVHLFPGNPHTPVHVVLAAPLGALPYQAARVVWFALSALAFVWGGFLAARAVGIERATALPIGIGVLAIPLVGMDLRYGQSNGFVLLAVCAAWWALRDDRARLPGIALGLATATRLFPGLLVIALLRRRAYRAAGWMTGTALALNLAALALIGPGGVASFVSASAENLWIWAAMPWNVSLSGAATRFWRPPGELSGALPAEAMLTVAVGVLVLAAVAWRSPAERTGDPFLVALPVMAAASPLAWEHYLIVVLPLVLAAAVRARPDVGMLVLGGALLLRVPMVGSWLASAGVPLDDAAIQAIRFALTLSLVIVVIAIEWRPRAASLSPDGWRRTGPTARTAASSAAR